VTMGRAAVRRPETRRQAVQCLERASEVLVPSVVEATHAGERRWSIFDRLLRDRIVFLGQEVDDTVANVIIAQLLFLEGEDPDKDIVLYINSPGGVVYSALAIYDTMKYIGSRISTTCIGMAASAAALLLASGSKGLRVALPHARVLIHQPHGGARGQASDIEIQAREVRYLKDTVTRIFSECCGKSEDILRLDMDRDNYMSAGTALEYGLIDKVLEPRASTRRARDGQPGS
jgi:ATP-dependent Clp protease, protease subunit